MPSEVTANENCKPVATWKGSPGRQVWRDQVWSLERNEGAGGGWAGGGGKSA